MTVTKAAALAFVLSLGACETLPAGGEAVSGAPVAGDAVAVGLGDGEQTLEPLQEASLPEKSCGMILWTLDAQRPAAVFRFVVGETGDIQIAGRPVSLVRSDFSGASGFGVFENQSFQGDEGVEVDVSARFGLGFDGGAYLESGLIKVRDASGWSVVTPAAGIAGCRS